MPLANFYRTLMIFQIGVLLNACASNYEPMDCTGVTVAISQNYNKNTHRFMKHDEKLVRLYGLDVVARPKALRLRGCTSLSDNTKKGVHIVSDGYYSNAYLHCSHYTNEPSIQIYQEFIHWAKQPLPIREQTQQQTNEKILQLNCPKSTAKSNEAAWYVENEQHTQNPVLVSNARDDRLLGTFSNRTIAIDVETAQYILQQIQQYFDK